MYSTSSAALLMKYDEICTRIYDSEIREATGRNVSVHELSRSWLRRRDFCSRSQLRDNSYALFFYEKSNKKFFFMIPTY